jgi:formylglycine-generating enzyme required for sulfatase activity
MPKETDTTQLSLVRGGSFASMPWQITTYWRDFEEAERMKQLRLNSLPTVGFRFVMREIPGADDDTLDIKLR